MERIWWGWLVKNGSCQVLFADDAELAADSEDKLQKLVEEFGRICERRKLKMNVTKSKVMRCSRRVGGWVGGPECKFEWGDVGGSGSF